MGSSVVQRIHWLMLKNVDPELGLFLKRVHCVGKKWFQIHSLFGWKAAWRLHRGPRGTPILRRGCANFYKTRNPTPILDSRHCKCQPTVVVKPIFIETSVVLIYIYFRFFIVGLSPAHEILMDSKVCVHSPAGS